MSKKHIHRETLSITYEGDAVQDRGMDVNDLAPAMLATGGLIQRVNKLVNGDRADVRVHVKQNFEHNCFEMALDVIQLAIEHKDIAVVSLKHLLGLIGFISGEVIELGKPLLEYLRMERDGFRCPHDVTSESVVSNLMDDVKLLGYILIILSVLKTKGYVSIKFRVSGRRIKSVTIKRPDAIAICKSCQERIDRAQYPRPIPADLEICTLDFPKNLNFWWFMYEGKKIRVNVAGTTIVQDAMEFGKPSIGDVYRVKLQIRNNVSKKGKSGKSYKIVEILEHIPAKSRKS